MRQTSKERKHMPPLFSNNLNECALCEATAQKAEHCFRVHGRLAARVRESLVL
jgi:hypothetical protein